MNLLSQTVPLQFDTIFSPFTADRFDEALAAVAAGGLTGVELAVAYPDKVDTDALNRKLAAHRLAATTLSTGQVYGRDGLELTSADADVRARTVAIVKGHVDLSRAIGHPHVTIGLMRGKGKPERLAACRALLKETLKPCLDYAAKHDVVLQLEPINHTELLLINSTDDALRFFDEMGNPENLGLLFDIYHSRIEDGDVIAAVRRAGKRITNVHLADSNRGLPFDGDTDFPSILAAILDTGYKGAFTLENLNLPDARYTETHFAERLKKVVSLAGERRA